MPDLPQPLGKFFADRGPHLAAMIAYFALLSFVPLLFLTVSLLSLAGRAEELERRSGEAAGAIVVDGRADDRPLPVEDHRCLDLRRDLGQVGKG